MSTTAGRGPVVTRRRGNALLCAIFDATLAQVADVGFEALTVEGVAARAGAGKASIYTRWSSREDLVLAALAALDDPFTDLRSHYGSTAPFDVRGALITVLGRYAEGLGTPVGRALRVLMTQRERHPRLYERVYGLTVVPRQEILTLVLERAAATGQIDAATITPWVLGAGPRLLIAQHLEHGVTTPQDVVDIVDQLLLPALRRPS